MGKIIELEVRGQSKSVTINKKNILIIGENGIGKSEYLKKFLDIKKNE